MAQPKSVEVVIERFRRLPGIGVKTAQRLAYHVLKSPREEIAELAQALLDVKDKVRTCSQCFNIAEEDSCGICADAARDRTLICVVEEPHDVISVEKTREYRGLYHVLQGALSPLEGIGPGELKVKELLPRVAQPGVKEVILATNPNIEGEATALYLARLLKPLGVKVTRIAHGLPVGSNLEYADEATMARAMDGRKEVSS
jgi:recombination protein RecR